MHAHHLFHATDAAAQALDRLDAGTIPEQGTLNTGLELLIPLCDQAHSLLSTVCADSLTLQLYTAQECRVRDRRAGASQ